jgi:hypothetical protein
MRVPQFSLKHLLAGFTLFAVGVFMVVRIFRYHLWTEPKYILQWLISGSLICAGLFTPIRRPILGAAIGLVAIAILTVVIFAIALQGLKIG